VLDSSGAGLPGATVNLTDAGGTTLRSAATLSDGSFSFAALPAGINVTVAPQPTVLFAFNPVVFTNLSSDESAMFPGQPRLYSVSGRVTTDSSIGLSNVIMTCNDGVTSSSALTDLNGNYSFTQMTAGRSITINAAVAGFLIANSSAYIPNLGCDTTGVDFVATAAPTPTPTPTPTPPAIPTPTPTPTPTPMPTPTGPAVYVAPNGSPTGDGSINKPWDLGTALSQQSNVRPGTTIYLRGGTYTGKFTSGLIGTPSAPIVVRSYPREWATLDGYVHTTLAVALPAQAGDPVTVVLSPNNGTFYRDGTTIRVGTENIYLSGLQPDGVTWKNCARAYGGSVGGASAHSQGDLVFDIANSFIINGQYTYYRDFELMNSATLRSWNTVDPPAGAYPVIGIFVNPSTGIKLINLVIHDVSIGIFSGSYAVDVESYGDIIYNVGVENSHGADGPGLYQQNLSDAQKKVRNLIVFNGFSTGMKSYSENYEVKNFLYEHIISFNNGSLLGHPGNGGNNGSPLAETSREPNIYGGTGNSNTGLNNILIHDCYLYHPFDAKPEVGNLGLGYQGHHSTGLEITNSRIMGGNNTFELNHFDSYTVTGNKFYEQTTSLGSVFNMLVDADLETGYSGTWNNNTYYSQQPYQGDLHLYYPFRFAINGAYTASCDGGSALQYSCTPVSGNGGWKQNSGLDVNSTWTPAAPTGTEVFVIPNEYEVGRAHIAIYNWALSPTVNVDLSSVLAAGDHYAVYAAENYLGAPVKTGTYDGKPVAVPMTGTSVAAPIGLGWTPATVRPQFGAFVVRKQ
jgi:hypothetical protein